MTAGPMEGKTAVFTFGSLQNEREPRGYDVDEPTRELPLVAGRFAGREWAAEDLRREFREKRKPEKAPVFRRRAAALAAAAAASVVMLVGSLLGQARLTAMNDEAAELTARIAEAQREQASLRVRYEQSMALSFAEDYAVETLGMQQPRGDQIHFVDGGGMDKATVLNIRRGRGLEHLWHSLVDKVGESFR